MKTIIFTDLDDTLFYSNRAINTYQKRGVIQAAEDLSVASLTQDGRPICFSRPKQRQLIQLLMQADHLIPVTGRASDSLSRVKAPQFNSFRVCSHGAIVLDAKQELLNEWTEVIQNELQSGSQALDLIIKELEAHAQKTSELRIKQVYDQALCTYISVKGPETLVDELAQSIKPLWTHGKIHHNQRNLAILPSYSDKARAVEFLINYFRQMSNEPLLFIGLGDSVSDLGFLKLCDFVLTPQTSQIHELYWP